MLEHKFKIGDTAISLLGHGICTIVDTSYIRDDGYSAYTVWLHDNKRYTMITEGFLIPTNNCDKEYNAMGILKVGDYARVISSRCIGAYSWNPIGKITSMSCHGGASPEFRVELIGGGTIHGLSMEELESVTEEEVEEAMGLFYSNHVGDYFHYADCSNKVATRIANKVPPVHDIPLQCLVKRIIYNDPATIVFWSDGTKTVVKRAPGEKYNRYFAFCSALAKKVYGNNTQVNKIVNSGYNQLIHNIVQVGKKAVKLYELRKKKAEDGEKAYRELQKKIMLLKMKQHMSYAQIAKRLDMAESSVRNIAKEAIEKGRKK